MILQMMSRQSAKLAQNQAVAKLTSQSHSIQAVRSLAVVDNSILSLQL
jgi:hypothetical protein